MPAEVSVVIAAYNVENYIERAIQSALAQDGVAVEVIVMNDNSSDGTMAAIARINDPRIKTINLPRNGGPSVARNAGFAAANAPWIAILDGDDAFAPGRLSRCLMRAKALNAEIVVDNLEVRREADGAHYPMFSATKFGRYATIDLARFIGGNLLIGGETSLGYTKPIFATQFMRDRRLSYKTNLRIGEDYMLMCEALANGALCVVEASAGYLYTIRKGSISHRLSLDDLALIAKADKEFVGRYPLGFVAARAQRRREQSIKEAAAYIRLVQAIKQRDVRSAIDALATCPPAIRHLWEPAWKRIQRLFGKRI